MTTPTSLLDFGSCAATCGPARTQHRARIRPGLPARRRRRHGSSPPPRQAILDFLGRIYGAVQENGCFRLPIPRHRSIRRYDLGAGAKAREASPPATKGAPACRRHRRATVSLAGGGKGARGIEGRRDRGTEGRRDVGKKGGTESEGEGGRGREG